MKKILLFTLAIFFLLPACEINSLCDDDFKIIALEVTGDDLDVHITRVKHDGRIAHSDSMPTGPVYTVLDDNYRHMIEGMTKTFVFYGYKGNQLIVQEEYEISADDCHINKVSGVSQVNL